MNGFILYVLEQGVDNIVVHLGQSKGLTLHLNTRNCCQLTARWNWPAGSLQWSNKAVPTFCCSSFALLNDLVIPVSHSETSFVVKMLQRCWLIP